MALGAATAGLRPVLVHQRFDFMLYAADQITNWVAPWRFISGGRAQVPLIVEDVREAPPADPDDFRLDGVFAREDDAHP